MNSSTTHRQLFAAMALLALGSSAILAAPDPHLREYVNQRFGFVLRCPAELQPGPVRSDGSGCEFHSPDGNFKVFAFAVPAGENPRQVISRRFSEELKMFGGDVSYQRKGEHWFVVSGTAQNGLEFYSKAYANSSALTLLRMTYPHAQNRKFDAWVTTIEKNFTSSRGAQPR